jgi:hypothetical protein
MLEQQTSSLFYMRRSVLLALAIIAGLHELALSSQPFLGETKELPGDEIVRLCVSRDGSVIAVGVRSYGRNCFLFRADGILLGAARVDALLPEVFCGANETLIAIDDAGIARKFAHGARTPLGPGKPPTIAEATEIAWSAQPVAFIETGAISALSFLRKLPTEIQGG